MTAGRDLPGWLLSLSFLATYINVVNFMGIPAGVFRTNWSLVMFVVPVPILAWAAARWAVPRYRDQKDPSAFAQMESSFGPATRRYAAMLYLLSQVLRQCVVIYLLAMIMHEMLDLNLLTTMFMFCATTTLYSVLGGLRSVVWTQAVQGLIMMSGVAVCLLVLGRAMPGGIENALPLAMAGGKLAFGDMSVSMTQPSVPLLLLIAVFGTFERYFIDQSYIQRYNSAQTNREARQGVVNSSWLHVGTVLTLYLIGTMLYCYYSDFTILLSDDVPHDYIFPFFVINQLPVGMSGFVLVALVCSAMATHAGMIASSSLTVLNDLVGRRAQGYDEMRRKTILRAAGISVSAVSMGLAIAIDFCHEWLNPWWVLSALLTGSLVGLLLLTVVARRATQRESIVASACGLGASIWIALWWWLELPDTGLHSYMADIVGTITTVSLGMLLAMLHDRKDNIREETHQQQ